MLKIESQSSICDFVFKILLLGDSNVGKTSILLRFADGKFKEVFTPTLGVDLKSKSINYNEKTVRLQMWDTAGQERFRHICSNYYRGASGIIYVFDVSDRNSFFQLETWINESVKIAGPNIKKLVIANKCDLKGDDRYVSKEEIKAFCEKQGVEYVEASAKKNKNIDLAFEKIVSKMVDSVENGETSTPQGTLKLNKEKESSGKKVINYSCCNTK